MTAVAELRPPANDICGSSASRPLRLRAPVLPIATRNICAMHRLERITAAFNSAGVPLLALKGAALNLTLFRAPHARPMTDLDLLVHPADVPAARRLLERSGCRRGADLLREDFFPRVYYELEYFCGDVYPTRIDLHARPFRPLRYACTVPPSAFWDAAAEVALGTARILVPSPEDMLLHLAVHAAVHGMPSGKWRTDIASWIAVYGTDLDWDRLVGRAAAWRLAWPVSCALEQCGANVPMDVERALRALGVNWRDRVALWHAPLDAQHPVRHALVNALCTPDWRLVVRYVAAVALPDSSHLATFYRRRHVGWQLCAHVLRWTAPLWRAVGRAGRWARDAWRQHKTW